MCLVKTTPIVNQEPIIGYVVMLPNPYQEGNYYSIYAAGPGYSLNKPAEATDESDIVTLFQKLAKLTYDPGFHGFYTLKDAWNFMVSMSENSWGLKRYCVVKAKFESPYLHGIFEYDRDELGTPAKRIPCFVAKSRTLLEPELKCPDNDNQ